MGDIMCSEPNFNKDGSINIINKEDDLLMPVNYCDTKSTMTSTSQAISQDDSASDVGESNNFLENMGFG